MQTSWIGARLSLAGLLLASSLAGCAAAAKQIAHEAAPPAATSGIQALDRPENLAALDDLARSPAAHQATWSLGNSIGNGIIAQTLAETGLGPPTDQAPGAPSTAPTSRPATGPATSPAATAIDSAAERLSAALDSSIRRGVDVALGPDSQKRVGQTAQAAGEGLARGLAMGLREQLAPALDEMIRQRLGPAIGESLARDVAPGARAVGRESAAGVLDGVGAWARGNNGQQDVRAIGKSATLGVHDGVVEAPPLPLAPLGDALGRATWIAGGLLVVAGLLVLALVLALFVLALAIWRTRATTPPAQVAGPAEPK